MSQPISVKEAERKAFRTTYNHGLWDILLGCFFLMFVFGPYLSPSLGDFWSTVVFIPIWGGDFLVLWLLHKYVVAPRVGVVKFGSVRKAKLMKFTLVMLVINVIAAILGAVAAITFNRVPGQMISVLFGLVLLAGFSIAAFFLDFNRLYIYGLLVGLSPLVGEWLWNQGKVSHHGFPLTFGISTGIMILTGVILFVRFLHDNPLPKPDIAPEEA